MVTLLQRFLFICGNLKNILHTAFRFGMWIYMDKASGHIVLWHWPSAIIGATVAEW